MKTLHSFIQSANKCSLMAIERVILEFLCRSAPDRAVASETSLVTPPPVAPHLPSPTTSGTGSNLSFPQDSSQSPREDAD